MFLTISELKEIALLMAGRLKVDYPNFNLSFFRRRLKYVFEKMNLRRPDDLKRVLDSLLKDDEITYFMAVPGTELFRAPSFWRRLRQLLLSIGDGKRIWIPCLSSYHELFSVLIILEMCGFRNTQIVVNVISDKIADDVRNLHLSRKNAETDRTNFEHLETDLPYDDYVSMTDNGPVLKAGISDNVSFRHGWFMNTDDEKFDVIVARNILLAYNRGLHERAIAKLTASLRGQGSVLCLGLMERPLGSQDAYDDSMAVDGVYILKSNE